MSVTAELLKQILAIYGDTLYRVALLLKGDERGAERLLLCFTRELVTAWSEAPPAPDDRSELVLLAALASIARATERSRHRWFRDLNRTPATGTPAIEQLPLEQRLALALSSLLGYDSPRIAAVLGGDASQARASLLGAIRALSPVAGHTLTDEVSGEFCLPVRDVLVDADAGAGQGTALRGHLAACACCRSFDHAWGENRRELDGAVRAQLRDQMLPPALAARMLALIRPRRRLSPTLRLTLPPLAVLVLIAALVLPGVLRTLVRVVPSEVSATIDPLPLLALAQQRQFTPPDGAGVWYARYRTLWPVDVGVEAPLIAEAWLDSRNAARHRLQLTHVDGGAPYEFQLGTGRDQLYYALDAIYAPAIYGRFPTQTYPQNPALITLLTAPEGQQRARDERLASGPWSLPVSYIRQAQAANDLRLLGQQQDGERTVALLSFAGNSPLDPPPEVEGSESVPVTILLAIDVEDGLLRTVTELIGPTGAEQVSRITWRVEEERLIGAAQELRELFDIERAWTGQGMFSEQGRRPSADLALPVIAAADVVDPIHLLAPTSRTQPWLPDQPPAGVNRALIVWPNLRPAEITSPDAVAYLGPDRRLLITFGNIRRAEGEPVREGVWEGVIQPRPGMQYRLHLERQGSDDIEGHGAPDPSAAMTIDAFGFSRDELLEVVRSLTPFAIPSLIAQDELFVGREGDPSIRSLLLQVVQSSVAMPEGEARYLRANNYSRQSPPSADERRDPYHGSPYDGQPETVQIEEWVANQGGLVRHTETRALESEDRYGQFYLDTSTSWYARPQVDVAYGYAFSNAPLIAYLPSPARAAFEMLTLSGGELTLEALPDGGSVITFKERAQDSFRYGSLLYLEGGAPDLADLRPITLITELRLNPVGEAEQVTLITEGEDSTRTVAQRYTVEEFRDVPLDEAPAALRDGAMPQAAYMSDFRGLHSWTEKPLAIRTLTETLALHSRDIYILDGISLQYVQDAPPGPPIPRHGGYFMEMPIGQGLALRMVYTLPSPDGSGPGGELRLNQGPAGPLRAWLRSQAEPPWRSSTLVRLTAAGRELDAWLGSGDRDYLIVEIDDTLLVIDGPRGWFVENGAAILANLRLASRQ